MPSGVAPFPCPYPSGGPMSASEIFGAAGIASTVLSAAVIVIAGFRTNTAKVWREEAEAQRARADRLQEDLKEIKERLTRIEAENKRLIQILTSLDPNRLPFRATFLDGD
jgi:DNA-binding transcriptional regulator GbsR (MarR family)